MLHVVTKTASQKLPRVRTRETEQTDECCIVSHKHRTSGSSSTYVTHDMVPRSLDHSTPLHSANKIGAGPSSQEGKDVLQVRLHVGALNVQARSADTTLMSDLFMATT
jgi:hypothetical protein